MKWYENRPSPKVGGKELVHYLGQEAKHIRRCWQLLKFCRLAFVGLVLSLAAPCFQVVLKRGQK